MQKNKTCNRCKNELPMTTDFFHKDKNKKDGFHTLCKPCRGVKPKKDDGIPNGFRECTKCKEVLPASTEWFHKDKYDKKCGLRYRCKKCTTKYKGKHTPAKDFTGKRFGKLTAIRPTSERVGSNIVWELKCDCGNTTHVHTGNLGEHHRKVRSCGCLHSEVVGVDLTGNKYGRLFVIKQGKHIGNKIGWLCKCDCGKSTTVSGTHLNSGATRSCGCIREEMVGTNHHNYNPNKTDEERLKKRYILGKHTLDGFRNKVYKRDNYTCQVCNQIGGKLNAHHLDGWNWAVDKRFDTDNGVTLCESCHNEFHNIYGKGNNTREQFEEYYNKHTKITLV